MSILSAVLGGNSLVLLFKGKSQAEKAAPPNNNPAPGVTVVPALAPATTPQLVGAAVPPVSDSDGTYAPTSVTTPAPVPALPTVVPSDTNSLVPGASEAPPSEPTPSSPPEASEPGTNTGTSGPAAPNSQPTPGPAKLAAPTPSSPAAQSSVASGAASGTDRGGVSVATDQDRRAAQAAAAAAVLASLVVTADTGKSGDKSDGKRRTTLDLLDQNQKSFTKLMSESDKKSATKSKTVASSEKPDDARSSDSKRVENAYAAYSAYDADETKAA